jgi:hypothetical protein
MARPERMITIQEVRSVLEQGEVIEDYPEDARGHSCLMLGFGAAGRLVHVVCAPKEEYLAIITVYIPNDKQWNADWKTRRRI